MTFDALLMVLAIIAGLSSLFFIMAVVADIVWPLLANRQPRRQATYLTRKP